MLLPSMSESDCVAKTTEAFFFLNVFSHSRSCRAKGGVVEDEPSLVDDEQRRATVEPAFDAVEQVGEHGGRRAGADQALGLEGLDGGGAEMLGLRVEQPAEGPADAIGLQRLLEGSRLQQDREPGDRPSLHGRRGEEFSADQICSLAVGSIGTPSLARIAATHSAAQGALGRIIDARQRLERNTVL